jgi:hypothetical protein
LPSQPTTNNPEENESTEKLGLDFPVSDLDHVARFAVVQKLQEFCRTLQGISLDLLVRLDRNARAK